jgi:hypothetical protein
MTTQLQSAARNPSTPLWPRIAGTASVLLLVIGCQYTPAFVIRTPANASTSVCSDPAGMACQVPVDIQWRGVLMQASPDLSLDGTTNAVALTASGSSQVGTFTTGVGSHTLTVSGSLSGNNTISSYSTTSSFTLSPQPPPVGGFALAAPTTATLIERGGSGSVTITVTRSPPFAGNVALALSSLAPAGVTATPTSIPAGQPSGSLPISVGAAAGNGPTTVMVTGTAPGVASATTGVRLIIGRKSGSFAEANPTPYTSTVPSTKASVAGGFRVDVSPGPPLPTPRKASFFRGTQSVGQPIGFTLGPTSTLGGAGFCANASPLAITRGVVLSGSLPGFSSQNVVTFLDLTSTSPVELTQPVDMQVQTSTGQLYAFQPRVFFSQDCTIAMMVGANTLGPSRNLLWLVDLENGQNIGSEVPFETSVFSAVLNTLPSKQQVVITVDTGFPTAATRTVDLP